MPQATRTPTQRRGRRYSHDLTRNLMRMGCEEGKLSLGARIETPSVTCDAFATPVTPSQCSPGPRSLGRTGVKREYARRWYGRAGPLVSRRDGAVAVHRAPRPSVLQYPRETHAPR